MLMQTYLYHPEKFQGNSAEIFKSYLDKRGISLPA